MNEIKRLKSRNLFSTLLVVVLAFAIALTVACSNTSGDTSASSSASSGTSASSSSAARTDYQVVTNGDFEFGTDTKSAEAYPVSSSINWTRSNDSLLNSATSSSKLSGIIDTDPETYKVIAEDQAFYKEDGSDEYYNPYTPEHFGLIAAEDLYEYDENNGNTDKLPTSGTKVLMIHNVTSEAGRGTAQKFTSTKTFDVESYGKISVWVATKGLKTVQDTKEFGAYVQLRTTIDTEVSPLTVKNINTDGEWINVTFYVAAHDYASTSFRVVLGLGFGSKDVRQEYVEGFAYFDNVTYTDLTKEEYQTAIAAKDAQFDYYKLNGDNQSELVEKEDLIYSMAKPANVKAILSNDDEQFTAYNFAVDCGIETSAVNVNSLPKNKGVNDNYAHADATYGEDVLSGVSPYSTIAGNALLEGVENPFGNNAETLYILHPTNASSYYEINSLPISDDNSIYISFYVKVETDMNMTGLTVSMRDNGDAKGDKKTLISAFTTKDHENEDYNDFAKVDLFISNRVGDGTERSFDLVFDFGTTDTVTDYKKLTTGYAVMTGFEATFISQEEYNKANSGTFVGMGSLGADKPNGAAESPTDDTYTFNYSATNEISIMNAPADNVTGFTGVVGGHKMVGGENKAYSQEATTAGIVNTEYLDNYTQLSADEKTVLTGLEKDGENEYLQVLMIKNAQPATYGYLSASKTITSGAATLVSVKVKVLGNAKAYIYLVNADSLEGFEVLDLTTYTYDNDKHQLTETDNFSKKIFQTVNATESADGWVTVNFLITAGKDDIEYRVELWNGSRDGGETSEGTVFFDSCTTSTVSDSTTLIAKLQAESDELPTTTSYTRVPTKVTYTDENGKEAVKYETYSPTDVYTEYAAGKTMIATYETVNVISERTETESDEEDTSESDSASGTGNQTGADVGLQIASIIIALVLVLVLIVIGIRMVLKKTNKEKGSSETYYSRDSRERAQQQINANKAKREAAAKAKMEEAKNAEANAEAPAKAETPAEQPTEAEAKANAEAPAEDAIEENATPEYDYDNMENNIPKDEE